MSVSDEQFEFLKDVSLLINKASVIGIKLTGGDLYRTSSQQYLYYYGYCINSALKLIKCKKRSWTKKSNHNNRLAIDLNFFIDGKLTYSHPKLNELGIYWESLNDKNRWGGFWNEKKKDTPHFERNL